MQNDITRLIAEVEPYIADCTVGFVKLSVHDRMEDAEPAGSGALVTIDGADGILTAGHVLRNLPDHGEVGVVRFPSREQHSAHKTTIDMELADKLVIGGEKTGAGGPDLGFLRLPPTDARDLNVRNVFLNLDKRREGVLGNKWRGMKCFDGISGMVADWTRALPPENARARVKGFRALYGVGMVVGKHAAHGFDLLDFEVTYEPGSASPDSFEGMSGGALWRVFCEEGDDGLLHASEKLVYGVAFHESDVADLKRVITCHGPRSVYGSLIDTVRERWPS